PWVGPFPIAQRTPASTACASKGASIAAGTSAGDASPGFAVGGPPSAASPTVASRPPSLPPPTVRTPSPQPSLDSQVDVSEITAATQPPSPQAWPSGQTTAAQTARSGIAIVSGVVG